MNNLYIITVTAFALIVFLISNYVSFGYGVRIGKAMQKDIPPAPLVEPVKKVTKHAIKLVRDFKGKSFLVKKPAEREKETIWD